MSKPRDSKGGHSRIEDSRALAWRALQAVHHDGAYANLVLPQLLRVSPLDQRDRGFVTELVYGALRREGELDVVIEEAARRATGTIDPETLDVLRIGVYQALFMRVSAHAVVDESVRLAKSRGLQRSSGFVNAVLRAVTARDQSEWQDVIAQSARCIVSHPLWIAREIEEALTHCVGDPDRDQALAAHNEAPSVTVALLPGLSALNEGDIRTLWSDMGVKLDSGDPSIDPRITAGTARVQDEGSQLAALLIARYEPLREGERVLDMCAGPGGKTAVLAAHALQAGAHVVAIEKVPHRARLVEDSVRAISERNPGVVEVRVGDATDVATATGVFDRVLLDAPCTGLGALRRRPEARWRKSPDDITTLQPLQISLLEAGLDSLAEGGVLAYVTCSPVTRETTDVVDAVMLDRSDIELIDTPEVLDQLTRNQMSDTRRGMGVQLWTHRHGTDDMFIQLLKKKISG